MKLIDKLIGFPGLIPARWRGPSTGTHVRVMSGSKISDDTTIGDYTYVGYNCHITRAVIGRYCSIANNVSVGMGEHKPRYLSTSSLFYRNAYEMLTEKDCVVGNDVWLAQNVIVRRGVTIADGAIVGANSFVNKPVAPFAIVAGSPAKLIDYRFNEEQISAIRAARWWDLDLDHATLALRRLSELLGIEYQ